jgi:8-oxo-dGTP diphosphatase
MSKKTDKNAIKKSLDISQTENQKVPPLEEVLGGAASETSIHEFEKPSLTVDCVVFGYDLKELKILLVNRKKAPYKDSWALPGGFLNVEESFEQCVERVLATKTGIVNLFVEQLYTFGRVNRDERGRVISVAYFALVNPHNYQLINGLANNEIQWFSYTELPQNLAFDHVDIIKLAHERLQNKVRYQPVGFNLLDKTFTLPELQRLYETILDKKIDRRNFRKKMLELGIIKTTGERREGTPNRQPDIYEFDKVRYDELLRDGLKVGLDF